MKSKSNNSLGSLVNGGIINLSNLWKPIEDSFRKIDKDMFLDTFGKVKDSFFTNSTNFANDLKEIFKDVKDTNKAFTYIVDFDEDKENIEYKIEDGEFGKNLHLIFRKETHKSSACGRNCELLNFS